MPNYYVEDLYTYYRELCDVDEGSVAMTAAVIARHLERGYQMYRRKVIQANKYVLATEVDITVSGKTYALDGANPVVIMGSGALSHARLEKLLEVQRLNSSNEYYWTYAGVTNPRDMQFPLQRLLEVGGERVRLHGAELRFEYSQSSAAVRLVYLGKPTVNWTRGNTNDLEFIDNTSWHQLIALYAYVEYAARDGAMSEPHLQLVASTEKEMLADLANGLFEDAADSISEETDW